MNLNQFTDDSFPFNLDDLMMLHSNLSTLRNQISDCIIDGLVGDGASCDVVENRIRSIHLKTQETSWGKQFGEYNEDGYWESLIVPDRLKKYFSEDEIEKMRFYIDNIDSCVSLINSLITQAIQQVTDQYLQNPDEDESCDPRTDLPSLSPELDKPEVKAVFQRAIEKGLMNERFVWLDDKGLLAVFCARIYLKYLLPRNPHLNSHGKPKLDWKLWEKLFQLPSGKIERGEMRGWYRNAKNNYTPKNIFLLDEVITEPNE